MILSFFNNGHPFYTLEIGLRKVNFIFSFSIYISYSHLHLPNCYLVSNLLKKIEIIEFNHTHLCHVMSNADTCWTSNTLWIWSVGYVMSDADTCWTSNTSETEYTFNMTCWCCMTFPTYIWKYWKWCNNFVITRWQVALHLPKTCFTCISWYLDWYLDIEYLILISY